jgi:hypothetical protein
MVQEQCTSQSAIYSKEGAVGCPEGGKTEKKRKEKKRKGRRSKKKTGISR